MDELCRALYEAHRDDPTIPGVLVAWVGHKFYGSVSRYTGKYAEGRYIVAQADGETVNECVRKLSAAWTEYAASVVPGKAQLEARL